jgi:hypothetical protein
MENLIYQITNEIKCLDAYVNAMKKVENSKPVLEDLENLQIHINNLKAWAGIDVETSENGLHKNFVSISLPNNEQIEQWGNSKEKVEDFMPTTLKTHITKKIECRIEGAKWMRDLLRQ